MKRLKVAIRLVIAVIIFIPMVLFYLVAAIFGSTVGKRDVQSIALWFRKLRSWVREPMHPIQI